MWDKGQVNLKAKDKHFGKYAYSLFILLTEDKNVVQWILSHYVSPPRNTVLRGRGHCTYFCDISLSKAQLLINVC